MWMHLIQSRYLGRTLMALAFAASVSAQAQINENYIVSVLNRNVQAKVDGIWVRPIPRPISAASTRATCAESGVTTYVQSDCLSIPLNGSVMKQRIRLGNTSALLASVTHSAPTATLTRQGQTISVAQQLLMDCT